MDPAVGARERAGRAAGAKAGIAVVAEAAAAVAAGDGPEEAQEKTKRGEAVAAREKQTHGAGRGAGSRRGSLVGVPAEVVAAAAAAEAVAEARLPEVVEAVVGRIGTEGGAAA